MTTASRKSRCAERALRLVVLLCGLAGGGVVSAEPMHAADAAPRLSHQSERIEAVAARDAQGLVVWVDDYASNRPLRGLAVTVRAGGANVQARESEPGTYRVPADLLGEADTFALTVRGEGWEEQFAGRLLAPSSVALDDGSARLVPALALGLGLAGGVAILLWRRRARRTT